MIRERAQIELHRAATLVQQGDPDAGATHACHAVESLPPTQRTQVVLEMARTVVRVIPPSQRDRPAVVDLLDRLDLTPALAGQLTQPR